MSARRRDKLEIVAYVDSAAVVANVDAAEEVVKYEFKLDVDIVAYVDDARVVVK